jgi:hypothetical protein
LVARRNTSSARLSTTGTYESRILSTDPVCGATAGIPSKEWHERTPGVVAKSGMASLLMAAGGNGEAAMRLTVPK